MLRGAVCGILGFGGIGQAVAQLMRAFGARIHAVNTSGPTSEPVDWVGTLGQLDELLAVTDVLVIAIPLTAVTRGLIGPRELGLMKPSATLVNVARGAIVDERALYRHLRANAGFSAAIDAWWDEPRGRARFRPLFLKLPNVLGRRTAAAVCPGPWRWRPAVPRRMPAASCAESACRHRAAADYAGLRPTGPSRIPARRIPAPGPPAGTRPLVTRPRGWLPPASRIRRQPVVARLLGPAPRVHVTHDADRVRVNVRSRRRSG